MRAMHNPGLNPVDNSPVDNAAFNPQAVRRPSTSAAPVVDNVSERCAARDYSAAEGYPQILIHLRFISYSEKLFICLFFF
ncbi:hypothetical protein D3C73_1510380 [compost metagenome]